MKGCTCARVSFEVNMSYTGDVAGNYGLDGLPLHIFLWIAGRSGAISPREVQVFLRMLDHSGWCQSRWARENLYRTHERYAASWNVDALSRMSRDLEALQIGLRCLREILTLSEAALVRVDLIRLAEATARASAGLLGHASLRREQKDALLVFAALAEAFLLVSDERVGSARVRSAPHALAAVPASPEAAVARPRAQARRAPVRCVQVIDETLDVKTFRFAALGDGRLEYLPGQFVTLEIPIGEETVRRSYTIASSPTRPNVVEVTVKRVSGGRVSNWLHDNLNVGAQLTMSGPFGTFSCQSTATSDKLLFISGGSGITPVMSMSRYLHDVADARDVVFLYSARTERDLIFRDELALLAARHPRFRPIFTLTHAGSPAWAGLTGRISARLIEDAVPDFRERTVFLCGPTPFMDAVKGALTEAEFPMANFHAESFGGAHTQAAGKAPPAAALSAAAVTDAVGADSAGIPIAVDRESHTPVPERRAPMIADAADGAKEAVVFSMSGREATGCADMTILEAAEGLGLPIPSACRVGVCGTCKTRKLSGTVRMDCEDGLDDGDRASGFVLACTARPIDKVTIEA
jgi:ferredoxin-NADP reductase